MDGDVYSDQLVEEFQEGKVMMTLNITSSSGTWEVWDRRGAGSLRVLVALLLTFSVGVATGVGVYMWMEGPSRSWPSENFPGNLQSRIENLEREIGILEDAIEEMGGKIGPGGGEAWPVDEIYRESRRSVVKVEVVKTSWGLFGPTKQTSQGSGFIYSDSGHILTNNHVVEGAEEILVTFWDGSTVEASLVGADPYSDVGVVKVDTSEIDAELPPVRLGDSSDLEPGDRIIAIGNPFGLSRTTTTGIVSQTGRLLMTETGYAIPAVIQIDAAINPGNSGGPLLDFEGQVVGITTAIKTQTGTFSGIGFATPSRLVEKVAMGLIEDGEYRHPWIGVGGEDVTYEIARERGLKRTRGFLITFIEPGGPADEYGLRREDIILRIDGKEIMGLEDILSYIELNGAPGDRISIEVLRGGELTEVPLVLGVRPPP